jgi:hypothetical protein
MSTRMSALHVPDVVEHTFHEATHAAAAVGHAVVETARHEADVVVDAVLSPLTVPLEDLEVEITEDDVL